MTPDGPRRDGAAAPARSPAGGHAPSDQTTGLLGLNSWPRVYLVVLVAFLVWVGLLYGLGRFFQ